MTWEITFSFSLLFNRLVDEESKSTDRHKTVPEAEDGGTETEEDAETDQEPDIPARFNIEFTFDTDVRVAITIYYFASEEISNGQAMCVPKLV